MTALKQDNPDTNARTALYDLHVELGGKMVPFAGYDMPVQYDGLGVMAEHNACREAAALFDVSHMGQIMITGADDIAARMEKLVPGDIQGLKPGQMRYSVLLNEKGGIMDDLMITRPAGEHADDGLYLVVNAATKHDDFAHIKAHIGDDVQMEWLGGDVHAYALIALQGPKAVDVLSKFIPAVKDLTFMTSGSFELDGVKLGIARSGYTGEDGFEISVPADDAIALAKKLLGEDGVEPAGLGARDSLRLEAGLCLYGHDIDTETTPVEAGLKWVVNKRRREEGGFPGADIILKQIAEGTDRLRVGIRPEGRAPVREGTELQDDNGNVIGTVTSGTFGPTLGAPVAMGYVVSEFAKPETQINAMVRGRTMPCRVAKTPFIKPGYKR